MDRDKKKYFEDMFRRLNESWLTRKEVLSYSRFFDNALWIFIPLITKNDGIKVTPEDIAYNFNNTLPGFQLSQEDTLNIFNTLNHSKEKKHLQLFSYGNNTYNGFCFPLSLNEEIFGFVILCAVKEEITQKLQDLFEAITEVAIREVNKEMELSELNETIRPRAIALSTVHTIHRLMMSTLHMNQLLPRIARLSMQVIKTNRCSIKLVDKKRKILLPKTTLDLRKEKTKLKKVIIGKYAPGRAVKQGRIILGKNYLAVPLIEDEILGVITLYDKIDNSEFTLNDAEIMKTFAEQAVIAIKNAQLYQEQENLTMGSIKCISMLVQNRPHSSHRAEAVFIKILTLICRTLKMNENDIRRIQYAAMLHDAGQISIPEELLMKKGELTGREYDIIKTHPVKGATILSKIKPLKPIFPIILYHHENFNGTGYPKGLKGNEIPLGARILAVIAAFEAMITTKPYRKPLTVDTAINELKRNAGTQFDPKIVNIFCQVIYKYGIYSLLKKNYKNN
ncbi:metal dependent phosphohydrolase [Candidatus Omnitrophus magneticus]|uniref:Metal dependent phosphohydrolase n=1 Tax=Candidatus Omnitrophus magneticus TaxID=1609969 RepID=A0A0F0CLH0_9BACT|nr:metal dependent phosphohydrolase [Candidatus Omnitrophus magneticus]